MKAGIAFLIICIFAAIAQLVLAYQSYDLAAAALAFSATLTGGTLAGAIMMIADDIGSRR